MSAKTWKGHPPVSFDEGLITRKSFLHMLKNYVLPQLNNASNLTLPPDGAPAHCTHTLNANFPGGWIEEEDQLCRPSFSWSYAFGLSSLGLCERPGVRPKGEYAGRTESTNHYSNCRCYSASGKSWAIGGMSADLQMAVTVKYSYFVPNNFTTCV